MSRSKYSFKSFKNDHRLIRLSSLFALLSLASGCSAVDRLSQIGETPKLNAIENPTTQPGYKPVSMPMPTPETVSYNANSLWRNGSRSFFKDQRAHQVGDLLTVTVNITETRRISPTRPSATAPAR
jgi:flagellar L-ring protein precursor FlgH